MRYILPEKTIRLVTGEPANLEITIETTNARMISLIEALGGRLIAPGMDVKITVTPATSGTPIIDEDDLVKAEPDTPAKTGRVCEICGKPLTDGRAKTCDDPACKKEKTRRYMRAYKQRVMMTATAGAEEELAKERRRCVLCGELYRHCKCKCTWCGAPIWRLVDGSWQHHIGGSNACRRAKTERSIGV